MRVIPAIDLLDGKVVRLQKGAYEDVTVYNENPLDEARKFERAGFKHIHIIDLNGARSGKHLNLNLIKKIKEQSRLSIQTGGGIRNYEDAERLIKNGIDQIVCSSMAFKNREDWLKLIDNFPDRLILGMDLKEGKMAYEGWTKTSDESLSSFLKPMISGGLKYVLCTDVSRDGMLRGANIKLYQRLQNEYPKLNFIASGGVAAAKDLKKLAQSGLYGVVVGRAYYENRLTFKEMKVYHNSWLAKK